MIHPSYVDLMKVMNSGVEFGEEPVVNSRYSIVIAASKRARQIIAGDEPFANSSNTISNGWFIQTLRLMISNSVCISPPSPCNSFSSFPASKNAFSSAYPASRFPSMISIQSLNSRSNRRFLSSCSFFTQYFR